MKEILVVDDYIVQQRVLRQVLTTAGYEVTVAGDGQEALEYLASNSYAMVILDIAMPDMDGIEVLSRIRSDNRISDLPVAMLTANDDEEAKIAARGKGANVFLTKPTSSGDIIKTVQELIGDPV